MTRSRMRRLVCLLAIAAAVAAIPLPVAAVARPPAAAIQHATAPSSLRPGSVNRTSMDLRAEYTVGVHLSFGKRTFNVDEVVVATNTSGVAIDRLELNTAVARLGGLRITAASVAGAAVHATISDQTIHLPLGGILDPGQTVTFRLIYASTLRSTTSGSSWLFTRANGILEAHRWIPWISKPLPFDRPNHGDPFVTGVSPRVRVTLVSDSTLVYATTGEPSAPNSAWVNRFEATNVRDFVFTAARDYSHRTGTVGNVTIRVWGRPGFPASTVLADAKTALSREIARLGAYPYPSYDLAQTAGGYGMESPGLTWIPTGAGSLPYLVAHETAHQWFYGIVGNDQAHQPFDDEAAADFVARSVMGLRRASRCATARLDLSIYQYSSTCYYEDIYIQGGNLLDDTRKAMGATAFWAAIHDYLAAHRFGIATTQSLLSTLDAHTSLDLGATRFRSRFPSLY